MSDFSKINRSIRQANRTVHALTDKWVLQADAQRHYHFRQDDAAIDQMVELLLTNSLLFGEDSEELEDEEVENSE